MPSTLSREQEHVLAIAIRTGSAEARDALVLASQGLVRRLAEKYGHSGIPKADIVQEGNLGLLRAIQEFDPDQGCRFSTYARWWVRSAMLGLILGTGDIIRVPPHHWRARHQESVTNEMASRLVSSEAVATILPLRSDQPIAPIENLTERHEDISLITEAIGHLNPVEAFVLRARFGIGQDPCTREVVAAQTGLSVAWIAKVQSQATEKLREMLGGDDRGKTTWKEPELKQWRVTLMSGKAIECKARNKSDARASFKATMGIYRKGRLPKGTVVEEI